METAPFQLPRLRTMWRHAAPRVFEGCIAPVAVFLIALELLGVIGAIVAGLGLAYGLIAWRLATHRTIPGLLLIGALTLTVRSILALMTGSVLLYFLQPTLGTAVVGCAFLFSAGTSRPMVGKIARDFCTIPDHVAHTVPMKRFFRQITLLWAATEIVNSAIAVWLLLSQSVGTYVVTRTASSLGLTALAIGASVIWFQRSMSNHCVFAPREVRVDDAMLTASNS